MRALCIGLCLAVAGCTPEEGEVEVTVSAWDMTRGCVAGYRVMRPAEYWPEDGWRCDFPPGEAVDIYGLCVLTRGGDCRNAAGEPTMWHADPYFRPCTEAPDCCGSADTRYFPDSYWCPEIPEP